VCVLLYREDIASVISPYKKLDLSKETKVFTWKWWSFLVSDGKILYCLALWFYCLKQHRNNQSSSLWPYGLNYCTKCFQFQCISHAFESESPNDWKLILGNSWNWICSFKMVEYCTFSVKLKRIKEEIFSFSLKWRPQYNYIGFGRIIII
jgi:hypothetical protein